MTKYHVKHHGRTARVWSVQRLSWTTNELDNERVDFSDWTHKGRFRTTIKLVNGRVGAGKRSSYHDKHGKHDCHYRCQQMWMRYTDRSSRVLVRTKVDDEKSVFTLRTICLCVMLAVKKPKRNSFFHRSAAMESFSSGLTRFTATPVGRNHEAFLQPVCSHSLIRVFSFLNYWNEISFGNTFWRTFWN